MHYKYILKTFFTENNMYSPYSFNYVCSIALQILF